VAELVVQFQHFHWCRIRAENEQRTLIISPSNARNRSAPLNIDKIFYDWLASLFYCFC